MRILLLIAGLAWHACVYAENDSPLWEKPNPFEKFRVPEAPPVQLPNKSQRDELITKYSGNIRPGEKLPDDVYECVLKHIEGVGSDVAAKLVWQSCLRLNLK